MFCVKLPRINLLSQAKMENNGIISKVYSDESIPALNRPVFVVPSIIKEARKLEKDVWGSSNSSIFVQQAKMLENYEDDFVYTKKSVHYFPTYRDLSDHELRGYFGWRTKLRHGKLEKTSLSFASIYCYELINQIGVSNVLDGYNKLVWFRNEYTKLDDSILKYIQPWLRDYVVYYGLADDLLIDDPIVKLDNAFADLQESIKSNEELFYALYELSIDAKSEYFLEDSDVSKAFKNISVNVIKKMSDYFKSHRKQGFWEDLFGVKWNDKWVEMFKSAVFYDIKKKEKYNCKYLLDDIRSYECKNGIWFVSGYSFSDKARYELTTIMLSIKSLICEYLGMNSEPCLYSKQWFVKLAKKEIKEYFEEEKRKKDAEVVIDYSRLSSIRIDAAETCEKLVTEDEINEKEEQLDNNVVINIPDDILQKNSSEKKELRAESELIAQRDNSNLNEKEILFIKCLLYNQDYSALIKEGVMLTVIIDSINEKLFDEIGDTVIEYTDKPVIVADYVEDLKLILKSE